MWALVRSDPIWNSGSAAQEEASVWSPTAAEHLQKTETQISHTASNALHGNHHQHHFMIYPLLVLQGQFKTVV